MGVCGSALQVAAGLYAAEDPVRQQRAVDTVAAWASRGAVPLAVQVSRVFIESRRCGVWGVGWSSL
jgi:hypothetical protein